MGLKVEHKTRVVCAVADIQRAVKELLSVLGDPAFLPASMIQNTVISFPLSSARTTLYSLQNSIQFFETVIEKIDQGMDRLESESQIRKDQKPGMISYDGKFTPGITKIGGGEHGNNH